MFAILTIITELTMKGTHQTDLHGLFQSNQGSRAPWFLFWMLVVIAVLAAVVAWWMKRDETDEAPPATSDDTPVAKPVAAQAVAPAAEDDAAEEDAPVVEEPAIEKTAPTEEAGQPAEEESTEVETDEPEESVEAETEEATSESDAPVEPDDLTKVEGIGPKISSVLQKQGISTYSQLANTNVEKLKQIMTDAKIRIAHPDTWPEQATLAATGDWDGLDKLQDELKGGRRAG